MWPLPAHELDHIFAVALVVFACILLCQMLAVSGYKYDQARRAAFGQHIHEDWSDALLALLADEADAEARRTFIERLPRSARPRAIIAELVAETIEKVRGDARLGLIALCEEADFTSIYVQRASSWRSEQRAIAADMLGNMRVDRALGTIERLLDDHSADVRLVAVRALGKIGRPESVDVLLAALEGKGVPAGAIAASILWIGAPGAPFVQAHLTDTSATVRILSAELLGHLQCEDAADALEQALADDVAAVRLYAARSLGVLAAQPATNALISALHDATPVVREAAATALGQIGDPQTAVVSALCNALRDDAHRVRLAAAGALAQFGHDGIRALTRVLLDDDEMPRTYAAEQLERCGYADRMARAWLLGQDRAADTSPAPSPARFLSALAAAGSIATLAAAGIEADALAQSVERERSRIPTATASDITAGRHGRAQRRNQGRDEVVSKLVSKTSAATPSATILPSDERPIITYTLDAGPFDMPDERG